MNFIKFAFLFVLAIVLQGTSYAQNWVSYESQQQINDLVETEDELLMATDIGLVVMNKATLEKTIYTKYNSNLTNNHIQTIALAPNGDAWIGTYDVVLGRFDGSDILDIQTPDSDEFIQNTKLYDLKIAPNGDLWVGTNKGVFHKEDQAWSHYAEDELGENFFEAWAVEINAAGEVFIGSRNINKFANGQWTDIAEGLNLSGYLDADLFISSTGDLFFSGSLEEVGRFDGTSWQTYSISFNGSEIKEFTEDTNGNVYFRTQQNGVFKLENDNWVPLDNEQTQAYENSISFFYIDEDNNHWLNNNIHLSVNDNGTIQNTLIAPHTLESNRTSVVHKGDNGKMYFITGSNNGFSAVDSDGNWTMLPYPSNAMPFEFFNDILVFSDDDMWLASSEGLYQYDGSNWAFFDLDYCHNFIVGNSNDKIYVAGSEGNVIIIEDGIISQYDTDNSEISEDIISGLGIDANDNLWIGSFSWDGDNTIQMVTADGSWTTYTSIDHPAIVRPSGDFVFDDEGNVWIVSDQAGAIKFDGLTFTNPMSDNSSEVTNIDIGDMKTDEEGRLYFAHEYGFTTLLNGEWENIINPNVPVFTSQFNSVIDFDDDGALWWGNRRTGVFAYTSANPTSVFSDYRAAFDYSIYPNPAKGFTTLDFTVQETAEVKACIYNQLGQLQSSVDLGQLARGDYQQRINLADFPKGFYTIQLQVNEQSSAKTIIIQ